MFKTGVEQMITILDEIATESDIGKIYMDACGLSLRQQQQILVENQKH